MLAVLTAPAALAPVAVTVNELVPTSSVEPVISPVAELIDIPGGRPAAVKVGDPPPKRVGVKEAIEVFFLP